MGEQSSLTRGRPDIALFIVTIILVVIGTVMIYSSSSIIAMEKYGDGYHYIKKQLLFVLIGLGVMAVTSRFPYQYWKKAAYPGVLISIALLSLVVIPGFGLKAGGATRWLRAGYLSFQVSELVKIMLVIFLAHYLTKKIGHIKEFSRVFVIPLVIMMIIVGLVLCQPDFGAAVIMVAVFMLMFYLAGSRIVYLAGIVAAVIPVGVVLILHESYRMQRFMSFLNPWEDPSNAGFQIIQSFICFGSGGAFGVGLGNGMQKLFYLPEPHTDFILSVIAEEGGFVGVVIIIVLFCIFIFRGFAISFNCTDMFGMLLASGLTTVIAMEAFINMAAVMGLLPTKGLVLPFLSYGGTSLMMCMLAVGILLNISSRREQNRGEMEGRS
ncbi:MAG: putative lipid II flippase FtsW, partial [Deltaproteobacteria bacterium]|nr:putative lipid II flippase FtsW [Deltaproteobacteria bacterium]